MGIFSPLVQTAVSPALHSNQVLAGASLDDVLDKAREYEHTFSKVKQSTSMPNPITSNLNHKESFELLPVASVDVANSPQHDDISHVDTTAAEQSMPISSPFSINQDGSAAVESSEVQDRLEASTKLLAAFQEMLTDEICVFEQNTFLDYASLEDLPSSRQRSRAVSDWTGLQELTATDAQVSITDLLQPLPVMRSSAEHFSSSDSTRSDGTKSEQKQDNAESDHSKYKMQSDSSEHAGHWGNAEYDPSTCNMQSDCTVCAGQWSDADCNQSTVNMQSDWAEFEGQGGDPEYGQIGAMWVVPCYSAAHCVAFTEPSPPEPPTGKELYKPKWVYGSSWPFNTAPTTLRLSNLPRDLTQQGLLQTLDSFGFSGFYDFVFLPTNLNTGRSRCHALVNLIRHKYGLTLAAHLHNFQDWDVGNDETCECKVEWSLPMQGLIEHIDHYRNHAVMHASVPDVMQPAIFAKGWRVPFPSPTKRIHAPRLGFQ